MWFLVIKPNKTVLPTVQVGRFLFTFALSFRCGSDSGGENAATAYCCVDGRNSKYNSWSRISCHIQQHARCSHTNTRRESDRVREQKTRQKKLANNDKWATSSCPNKNKKNHIYTQSPTKQLTNCAHHERKTRKGNKNAERQNENWTKMRWNISLLQFFVVVMNESLRSK